MKLDEFARHSLTLGPSPVHRLDRLTGHLGGAQLWAKREDCNAHLGGQPALSAYAAVLR